MEISCSALNLLSELLDNESYTKISERVFYPDILEKLSGNVKSSVSGIYFIDDVSLNKKAFRNDLQTNTKKAFFGNNPEAFLDFLSNYDKTFCVPCLKIAPLLRDKNKCGKFNFIFSKLSIKGSLFGFLFLARPESFSDSETALVNLFVSIYSYLIKDYELNKVFKTQLSLLQDAISDKENAYKIIEKQNKKLLKADSVKTNFLANVSHELRTPLNAIMGFSDVLLNQIFGTLNDKQLEYVKDINLSSIHLMGLINTLLDFSKIDSGSVKLQISRFAPSKAVQEVINILKPLIEAKEIKLTINDTCEDEIAADYQKFQQILFNLIGNAIKFSKQKGKIIVKTYKDGEYFILEVQDFGIGIDKKYHNFIFKKFTQIDNIFTKTGNSTGLGLAITKEYVKLHSGKIYVESAAGKGSTFVVKLKSNSIKTV